MCHNLLLLQLCKQLTAYWPIERAQVQMSFYTALRKFFLPSKMNHQTKKLQKFEISQMGRLKNKYPKLILKANRHMTTLITFENKNMKHPTSVFEANHQIITLILKLKLPLFSDSNQKRKERNEKGKGRERGRKGRGKEGQGTSFVQKEKEEKRKKMSVFTPNLPTLGAMVFLTKFVHCFPLNPSIPFFLY